MRLAPVLLATLMILFGLQTFRVFLPSTIWYLSELIGPRGAVPYLLGTLGLILLTPLIRRWLGGRGALFLTVTGLAAVRLALQLEKGPLGDLVLATLGLALWGGFLSLWFTRPTRYPAEEVPPGLALAFPLAFVLDTANRTVLLSYDLVWWHADWATILVAGLAGLALVLLWREMVRPASDRTPDERGWSQVLPLAGLGPWLYLSLTLIHNPAAWAAWTGWRDIPAHLAVNGATALGALVCVLVAGAPLHPRRWFTFSGGGLLFTSLLLLILKVGPAWLWLGTSTPAAWAVLGGLSTSAAHERPPKHNLWRGNLAICVALLIPLALIGLVNRYDALWALPLSGAVLTLAAALTERIREGFKSAWLQARMAILVVAILITQVSVGLWILLGWNTSVSVASSAPQQRLRVMTYNIHNGLNDHDRMNLDELARVVAVQDPDVVVLNEVNRAWATNGFVDTLPLIASRLGMKYVFGPTYRNGLYGNAILSRYPIGEWANIPYQHNTTEVRSLLKAVIEAPAGAITVFATHLDCLTGAGNVRAEQVAEMLSAWGGKTPAILAGDLNAPPDAPELQPIYQAGFVDVLAATGRDDAFTFWDAAARQRIDFIFATPDLPVEKAWVVPSHASDHLPVVADVGF